MTAIETLKQWFSNLKKPTQEQFWAWLDSFWHKSEKIPMASVEGLDKLVEGTASAEQLSNHLNDTQAHKVLFDKKVDKVEGRELSSNDYTDEEKARNTENEKWRAVGMSVTGEANKTITLTFKNGEVLTAPFADIAGGGDAGPDVKLNSLAFDLTTGILTGNRSDGTPITVNLDGRYALLRHTHNINDLNNIDGLNNNNKKITNVAEPESDTDAATKKYVDTKLNSLNTAANGWVTTINKIANDGTGEPLNHRYAGYVITAENSDDTVAFEYKGTPYQFSIVNVSSTQTINFYSINNTPITYTGEYKLKGIGSTAAIICMEHIVIIKINNVS